jgi:hypothetical protein
MLTKIISKIKTLGSISSQLNALRSQISTTSSTQEVQVLLKNQYKEYTSSPQSVRPSFDDVGFKAYSQFEEDGILLYIFSTIGVTNKKVVEICAGNGHGWSGYLFDGDSKSVEIGKQFFAQNSRTFLLPPFFKQAWFTAENINQILTDAGVVGEVDLLSMDIDGMDYWVWKAIECIQPRVCIFETQNCIPSDLSLTAKYDPKFYYRNQPVEQQDYRSASLLATTKLSESKGYRLIGSHRHGFNCLFMRNDVGEEFFPAVSVESCHDNPYTQHVQKY